MKRPLLLLPLLALALYVATTGTIWGCAALRPNIGLPDPSTFTIRVHRGGRVVQRVDSPNWSDEELALLREWTASLGEGGSVSFNTFAPSLVVSSDTFNANFLLDGTLVLNARSANGSNWIQRVRAQTPLDAAVGLLALEKAAMSKALTLEVKEKAEAILREADSEDGVEYFLTNEQKSKVLNSLGTDDNRWVVQFEKQPERITTNRYCGLKFEEVIQQLGTPNEITYPSSNMVQWISGQVGIQAPTTSVVVLLYDTHSQIGGETYILLQISSNMIERVLGDIEIPPGVLM